MTRGTLTPSRRRARSGGFTLAELAMGIALAMIFGGGLYSFFFSGLDTANSQQSQVTAQTELRRAVDVMSRDLRQAITPDDGINGGIATLNAASMIIYVDSTRSASTLNPRPTRVRYQITGTGFTREVAQPTTSTPPYSYGPYSPPDVLVTALGNGATPLFQSFTEQGVALANPVSSTRTRDIKTVRITLRAAQKTGLKATNAELSTDVTLRNTPKF